MRTILIILLFALAGIAHSQDKLYHESGGFGTENNFGLQGEVYRVTNLSNEGEGSLRSFLEMTGPRLIVFEVGGIIDLEGSDLRIDEGGLTIAGQTAPYPGITLINGSMRVNADEVLIQHLSIRPGDGGFSEPVDWEPDGISVTSGNVVIDHCSVSWAVDENMSVARGGNNVTFYRCIIAEGLSNSIHAKGEHSCGSLVTFDTWNVSIIGCYYAHNYRRHPRYADGAELLFANNVIYNYGIYAAHVGANTGAGNPDDPGIADFIGNAFFKGVDGWDDFMLEIHRGDFDKNNPPAVGKAYWEDNLGLDRTNGNMLIPYDEYIEVLESSHIKPDAFQAFDAYDNIQRVLTHVGARPSQRSETDARLIRSLIHGTGSVIDRQSEVGGYPVYPDSTRLLGEIPLTADERRIWLDSISSVMESDDDLDLSELYNFIDAHWSSSSAIRDIPAFRCYPSMSRGSFVLSGRLKHSGSYSLHLVDLKGRVISLGEYEAISGQNLEHRLELEDLLLPDGLYLLLLSNEGERSGKRIILRH